MCFFRIGGLVEEFLDVFVFVSFVVFGVFLLLGCRLGVFWCLSMPHIVVKVQKKIEKVQNL